MFRSLILSSLIRHTPPLFKRQHLWHKTLPHTGQPHRHRDTRPRGHHPPLDDVRFRFLPSQTSTRACRPPRACYPSSRGLLLPEPTVHTYIGISADSRRAGPPPPTVRHLLIMSARLRSAHWWYYIAIQTAISGNFCVAQWLLWHGMRTYDSVPYIRECVVISSGKAVVYRPLE